MRRRDLFGGIAPLLLFVFLAMVPVAATAGTVDTDGDTICDDDEGVATNRDVDGDFIPDYLDLDSDGDGIPDAIEAGDADILTPPRDTDNDGLPNFVDVDSDNDKLPDAVEDPDGDGMVSEDETDPLNPDTDGDGLTDGQEDPNLNGQVDPGEPDPRVTDSDGDGILDGFDVCPTNPEDFDGVADGDGCPDADADSDGLLDTLEQGHPCLDPENPDVDGDTLFDGTEDLNRNGIVDPGETDPCNADTDGDTFNDNVDACPLLPEDQIDDVNADGCPKVVTDSGPGEIDTDQDGLPDVVEMRGCTDVLNPDSDGDGVLDGVEDANQNGVVDSGESNPCKTDIIPSGGVGCSTVGATDGIAWFAMLLLVLMGVAVVRRRSQTDGAKRRGRGS